jgi:hypothetical protein
MSRWWRAYDEAVDDPKLILLSDKAHRAWFCLMCVASANGGVLPDIKIVAVKLRTTPQRAAAALAELVQAGLFDQREDGKFEPHNWSVRQYKSDVTDPTNASRQKRYRDRHRNGQNTVTDTVTVTPPREQRQITDTEAEKKETRANALAEGWPADFREQFWARYPNKVGKPKALAKLDQCMRRGIGFAEIMDGLERYIASKPADRAWLNPETFINQERWADQPAAVTNGRRTVQQAADDLLEKLRLFDEPAPDGLCDATGENAVRLLPPH